MSFAVRVVDGSVASAFVCFVCVCVTCVMCVIACLLSGIWVCIFFSLSLSVHTCVLYMYMVENTWVCVRAFDFVFVCACTYFFRVQRNTALM